MDGPSLICFCQLFVDLCVAIRYRKAIQVSLGDGFKFFPQVFLDRFGVGLLPPVNKKFAKTLAEYCFS